MSMHIYDEQWTRLFHFTSPVVFVPPSLHFRTHIAIVISVVIQFTAIYLLPLHSMSATYSVEDA